MSEEEHILDPTKLTTIALARDINALRDVVKSDMEGFKNTFQAQIEGHWALDQERFNQVDKRILDVDSHRSELNSERFRAVELRFAERDLRFTQTAVDNADAIKAALSAVNNATVRLENTFTKQIEGLAERLDKQVLGIAERITDLKDRITGLEGNRKGGESVIGWVIGSAGAIVAGIAVVFSIIHFVPNQPLH